MCPIQFSSLRGRKGGPGTGASWESREGPVRNFDEGEIPSRETTSLHYGPSSGVVVVGQGGTPYFSVQLPTSRMTIAPVTLQLLGRWQYLYPLPCGPVVLEDQDRGKHQPARQVYALRESASWGALIGGDPFELKILGWQK